ncbi:MAG: phosphonate metabolism protein PhnM [Paracoccus sp.]|uniref:alpha-D-ribose 1-methylphosphonate 5-triphosphate diphosphatase n=1 Tax=unclassified Paracoccus (in: a-proteobacteria) TaxID=2688777 RepID=UPI000C4CA3AF|nr:alpha-D-ribose 1-methylphosphonate 5-triphosphate diphosphatase [Paracoccus sp. UBA5162]MAN56116.1 phosphonate metabolism protein PhnM [Paracoccus sp. (in: a-proteobacteria)]|tara:strand:- start:16448 stop:17581 length:1134 start_codon:yes stop_codon:yes gene_type:complete
MMILANAELILPDRVMRGAIHVEDGVIVAISEGAAVPPGAMDCGGDHVAPGLVELHTDNLERHIQPRPGVDWPHAAAIFAHDGELASAGITTVLDAVRVGSIPEDGAGYAKYARPLVSEINALQAEGRTRISHWIHLRAEICSRTLLDELAEFGPQDRVRLVSLMDHTPGQRQFRDIAKLARFVQGRKGLTDAAFADHVARLTALRDRFGAAHEAGAVAAARRLGATLASHDDTTADQVATSAGYGIRLAEFPTTEEAARACHDHGIAVMMGGPNLIRGGSHSGNVAAEAMARDGLLDIISSDYVPSSLLLGAQHLARVWKDPARAFATVTDAPARATGLTDRGRIGTGLRADLIRLADMDRTLRVAGVWVKGRQVG